MAAEPGGRQYGPATFRCHYSGNVYLPHFNHEGVDNPAAVEGYRLDVGKVHGAGKSLAEYRRETPEDQSGFAAQGFAHQLAGLVCLSHSDPAEERVGGHDDLGRPQALIYRVWHGPEQIGDGCSGGERFRYPYSNAWGSGDRTRWDAWVAENGIESCLLSVEPGDFCAPRASVPSVFARRV